LQNGVTRQFILRQKMDMPFERTIGDSLYRMGSFILALTECENRQAAKRSLISRSLVSARSDHDCPSEIR
jgi:hypothetical protein